MLRGRINLHRSAIRVRGGLTVRRFISDAIVPFAVVDEILVVLLILVVIFVIILILVVAIQIFRLVLEWL